MSAPADEILFEVRGALGLITLNRPAALNSLTTHMCARLRNQLGHWAADPTVGAVAVTGAGDKAFCAGGDVVQVSRDYRAGGDTWRDFFNTEYRMNVAIDEFPKPYIALVDGIAMGGGVGVSIPGDFWIATEKTLFAMPETGLGLFPDVGGGWFLPRLPGAVGMYLALTGTRLRTADLFALGIASHVVPSDGMDRLIDQLAGAASGGVDAVAAVLDAAHSAPGPAAINAHLPAIDRLFAGQSVEMMLADLAADGSAWATQQHKILAGKSPLSLKITHRQLTTGARLDRFRDAMVMEYRMVQRAVADHDFHEGVRALLVDKDKAPHWRPATLDEIPEERVAAFFAPLDTDLSFDNRN